MDKKEIKALAREIVRLTGSEPVTTSGVALMLERMVPLVMSMHTDLLLISRFLEEIAEEKSNAVGSM